MVDQEGEALAAAGHEVIRFERDSDGIGEWSRAKKASLPLRVIWNREAYGDLTATLRRQAPDVVHVHNTFPLLSAAVLHACRDAAVPVVATIHNRRLACASGDFFRDGATCHECASGPPIPAVLHGCYRGSRVATVPVALTAIAHRRAWRSLVSAYVFVSKSIRASLAGLGLPPQRVFIRDPLIPSQPLVQAARDPVVLYAGRLDEAKGARVLMTSWDRYRDGAGDPGLRLIIAGGGVLQDEVTEWASARSSVDFLGQVSRERCAGLMARARAVVVPSLCEESFGLTIAEAMSAGAPPIAAGHGAFPELITPGVDGVLVAPGDPAALAAAIADVEANPARYESYGARAYVTYQQRFNPERNLSELLGIYRFAVAHPAQCGGRQLRAAAAGATAGD